MIKRGNKKADANMMWVVIGLVLALFVLVMAIVFFTGGGNKFLEIFRAIFPQKENVDTIKTACGTACSLGSIDAWCNQQRTIYFKQSDKLYTANGTCDQWVSDKLTITPEGVAPGIKPIKPDACSLITCP
jgi:hypothetical protein